MKTFLTLCVLVSTSAFAGHVLYIGDSHSHIREMTNVEVQKRYGNVFVEAMEPRGHEVTYYAACGSTSAGWAQGGRTECGFTLYKNRMLKTLTKSLFPSVKDFYSADLYDFLVVNLGDNMFVWKSVSGKRVGTYDANLLTRNLDAFFTALGELPKDGCAWIGPTYHVEGPHYRKTNSEVDKFYEGLVSGLEGRCRLIDSRPMVVPTVRNDGLHHVNADSAQWARGTLDLL